VPAQAILTVNYQEMSAAGWPRILRILAVIVLLYASAGLVLVLIDARRLWPFVRVPFISAPASRYWLWFISSVATAIINSVLIIGAIALLRRGSRRMILIGAWATVVEWMISFGIGVMFWPPEWDSSLLIGSIIYGMNFCLFPVMVILCLRAARTG